MDKIVEFIKSKNIRQLYVIGGKMIWVVYLKQVL